MAGCQHERSGCGSRVDMWTVCDWVHRLFSSRTPHRAVPAPTGGFITLEGAEAESAGLGQSISVCGTGKGHAPAVTVYRGAENARTMQEI